VAELSPVWTDGERVYNFWGKDLCSISGTKAMLVGKQKKWDREGWLVVIIPGGHTLRKEVRGRATMQRAWKWAEAWNKAAEAAAARGEKGKSKHGQAQAGNGPVNEHRDDSGRADVAPAPG
jgi:hypothetical protein